MAKNGIYAIGVTLLLISSLKFMQQFHPALLAEAFQENAGTMESLPAEIVSLKTLMTRHHLQRFNLAEEMNDNPLLHQRAVEYTYPAKLDSTAKNVFAIKGTLLPNSCRLIDHQENIEHYVCQ